MKRLLVSLFAALAFFTLSPISAKAEMVSPSDLVEWDFKWTHTIPGSILQADDSLNAGVTVSQESGSAIGSTDYVASNLTTFSSATADNPSVFNANGAYTLTLTITDKASGDSKTLDFSGKLSGTFGAGFSKIRNTYSSTEPQQLYFDKSGNTYVVWLDQYTPPGNQTSLNKGSLGGFIQVIAGGDVQKVPEPSTLLLGGFGLSLAGLRWMRKRRQA
jgi:hypothetical protein